MPYYIVVQEGGSSSEFYASAYETRKKAELAIAKHEKASYRALGPFVVPDMPEVTLFAVMEAMEEALTQTSRW